MRIFLTSHYYTLKKVHKLIYGKKNFQFPNFMILNKN